MDEPRSNTAQNTKVVGAPFKKGDKRINRKGRPKSFDKLRELAKAIGSEAIDVTTKGGLNVRMTRIEAIMRQWAMSPSHQLQRAFVEIAYGKVPDTIEVSAPGGGPIEFTEVVVEMPDNGKDAVED